MPSDIWLMPFHHDEVARDRNSKNVKDRCRHHLPLQISTFKNLVELVHLNGRGIFDMHLRFSAAITQIRTTLHCVAHA